MNSSPTVSGALRRFLSDWLRTNPPLGQHQRRAIWAITHCRSAALGWQLFACRKCGKVHFAYHSCNHKACPLCGRHAIRQWVQRELAKQINAPYFLVTFTLPAELRECFFGTYAKQAYDLFFGAVSAALSEKLAAGKGLRAHINGFTAALHTWNQRLEFHPHIHCLVPGAGLDARGRPVRVKDPNFLVYVPHLQAAFRQHMRRLLEENDWQVDPTVWTKEWGVHIQPAGSGAPAIKYLGAYVARTAITDARILKLTDDSVTFRWQDRSNNNRLETLTLPGIEFVRRYMRHVLPKGLRSVRYFGFCHPAAKANRLRVQFHTGLTVQFGALADTQATESNPLSPPPCPYCGGDTRFLFSFRPFHRKRGPPLRPYLQPQLTPIAP